MHDYGRDSGYQHLEGHVNVLDLALVVGVRQADIHLNRMHAPYRQTQSSNHATDPLRNTVVMY